MPCKYFMFVPDPRIFDLAIMSRQNGELSEYLTFFNKSFVYMVDCQKRIIFIPPELDNYLVTKGLDVKNVKRRNLFYVIRRFKTDESYDTPLNAALNLASRLTIKFDNEDIYFVTNDDELIERLSKRPKQVFKYIKLQKAIELIEEENKKIKEDFKKELLEFNSRPNK